MLTASDTVRNERGSVLMVGLLVMTLLTIIGISATFITATDLKISSNDKVHKISFYAAEAGIEVGRTVLSNLKAADSGNWDNLLAGNDLVGQSVGIATLNQVIDDTWSRNVGPASYLLQVRDNQDLDGSSTVDTDNMIVLISTGSYLNAEVEIEALVRYEGGGDQYAQEHYDTDSSGRAARESNAVQGTLRWP